MKWELSDEQCQKYLARINVNASPTSLKTDLDTLTYLHRCHCFGIAFETLDVVMGIPIEMDLPKLYEKVIVRGRGGFCYEVLKKFIERLLILFCFFLFSSIAQ